MGTTCKLMKYYFLFLFMIFTSFLQIVGVPVEQNNDLNLKLIILHNNDMHARFEETNSRSGKCSKEEKSQNLCYGGFARVAYEVQRYRELARKPGGTPVLFLNAGDTYTGTPWFTVFKDKIAAEFLNAIKPDAMSLGNHEFDEGVNGLIPLLNAIKFPVVTTNLNLNKVPELASNKNLTKSAVFTVNGIRIGIIGYLTPDTKFLAFPNDVEYYSEVESINHEAKVLKDMGINILIALGHSGYIKDQEIAKMCPDIDLVIGGHTNTFLYNGKPPDLEQPEGPYPKVVEQQNGKKVPVVQAYAYTKYLGYLSVEFDKSGNLISWKGQPILLNNKIPEDPKILDLLEVYRPNISALENEILGYTRVNLDGSCRSKECNLGNLITDAMIYTRLLNAHDLNTINGWTDVSIAFLQGGGIRASISKTSDGAITKTDLLTTLPFNNQLYMIEVKGSIIRRALEHSASLFKSDSNGGFLQMSGVNVVYNVNNSIGNRVIDVRVLCADCEIPHYTKLLDDKNYKIILTGFLLNGGDGHNWFEKLTKNPIENAIPLQSTESEALTLYIKNRSPIYPGLEYRINIIGDSDFISGEWQCKKNGSNQIFLTSYLFILIAISTLGLIKKINFV